MRSFVPTYELRTPGNLVAALGLLAGDPGVWRPFAGGTDLMVLLEAGKLSHRRYINLWGISDLRGIAETPTHVILGAMTTYSDLRENKKLAREFTMLCRAAAETGGIATQNRGTIGGNIANASPAADSPPALLVYDAELELISAKGTRRVPYAGFHSGYKKMNLRPGELISRIFLPRGVERSATYYRKVGARRAQAISKVCMAASLRRTNGAVEDVRIALGSVAPTVIRATRTEAQLSGRPLDSVAVAAARATLAAEIAPIDDMRSTARYRARVAENLLQEFLEGALRQ